MSNPTEKEKRIKLWTPAVNMFFVSKSVYSGVRTVLYVFLTYVLKTPRIRLRVWHVNSLRWSRSGVINARCSVRASLWARRGVWARLTLLSLLPPPPLTSAGVMFVCHLARCQRGGKLDSPLGTRPLRSYAVQSTSVLFSACMLAPLRALDEGDVCLHRYTYRTWLRRSNCKSETFFFCIIVCSPLVLYENILDFKKRVCSKKKVFIPMLSSSQWALSLPQRSGAL